MKFDMYKIQSVKMSFKTFTELFEDIETDLSIGWKELPISQRDVKRFSLSSTDALTKFSVDVEYKDKAITTTYYGSENIPETGNVFGILVTDALAVDNNTFPDFCRNHGYDTDSIKAFNVFKYCKKQQKKLMYLLGEELYAFFMGCDFDW